MKNPSVWGLWSLLHKEEEACCFGCVRGSRATVPCKMPRVSGLGRIKGREFTFPIRVLGSLGRHIGALSFLGLFREAGLFIGG